MCALMLSLDVLDVSGTNENDAGFAKVRAESRGEGEGAGTTRRGG